MEYLPPSNRVQEGDLTQSPIDAAGKHVVIIGGGDTGADCLGTAHRQGAASVAQLEILPLPPEQRPESQPWPTYPMIYRVSSAHEEGGERLFSVSTQQFLDDGEGRVRALRLVEVVSEGHKFVPVEGSERDLPCDLVLLAMGFVGPEKGKLLEGLGVGYDLRGNVDMGRGQSLIVWAIAEGRSAAAGVDHYLTGRDVLPAPITPTDRPLA
jgi:glutamate synthase (NADPH/NADH) small chain